MAVLFIVSTINEGVQIQFNVRFRLLVLQMFF